MRCRPYRTIAVRHVAIALTNKHANNQTLKGVSTIVPVPTASAVFEMLVNAIPPAASAIRRQANGSAPGIASANASTDQTARPMMPFVGVCVRVVKCHRFQTDASRHDVIAVLIQTARPMMQSVRGSA